MDKRHVYMIYDILRAWPFKSALELGSYHGASSTAFVEAIGQGSPMHATFCEPVITPSLVSVLSSCLYHSRIGVAPIASWDVLAKDCEFDFVLVDACHDLESVKREVEHLTRRRPLCVMGHDTHATESGYPACEGAQLLKGTFANSGYWWLEDAQKREGEKTERGLFLATTNRELFGIAEKVYEKWS